MPEFGLLVAVVAGREHERLPLHRALPERLLGRGEIGRADLVGVEAPVGVRHDRDVVVVDDAVERRRRCRCCCSCARRSMHARARRHAVHGLDVERLLAEPAGGVTLVGTGVHRLAHAGLRELPAAERAVTVARGVGVRVLLDGRRRVRVDDADALSGARVARRVLLVGAAELARRVAADRVRQRLALERGQRRLAVGLLARLDRAVGVRARARVDEAVGGGIGAAGFIRTTSVDSPWMASTCEATALGRLAALVGAWNERPPRV